MAGKRDRWDSSSSEEEEIDNSSSRRQERKKCSNKSKSVDESSSSDDVHANNNYNNTCSSNGVVQVHDGQSLVDGGLEEDLEKRCRIHNPLLHGCRSVYESFERLDRIDEGTYGIVWKAKDLATKEIVALKQIKFDAEMTKEGFPMAALREINVLLELSHENIVTVREMVVGDSSDQVFMVMECMECDLSGAMKKTLNTALTQADLKHLLYQILSAVSHIHDKWYIHRDMKTSNILVHKSGRICVCDFGLARKYQEPRKPLTQMVITLWYRPPELLFGENKYGPEVDMWSVGCIFAELITRKALLQGQGELDQIDKIFKLLGTPNENNWPNFPNLPSAKTFRWRSKDGSKLHKVIPVGSFSSSQSFLDSLGFDLLSKMLTLDPDRRISASDALNHKYFTEGIAMPKTHRFQFDH